MPAFKSEQQQNLHTIELNHQGRTRTFHLRPTRMGLLVAQYIFSGATYPILPMPGEVRTIVDIGANIGAAAVYFSLHYPAARIFAFEPDPGSFELLKKNVADLAQISAFPYGLSDRHTAQPLYQGREDSVTNSLLRSPLNSDQSISVELRPADEVLRELGIDAIDILKIDTEGCEVEILSKMSPWLAKTGCIYVEYHHADDRIAIEKLLMGTHWLCHGRISSPHRGEFAYISRARMPSVAKWDQDKVERR